MKKVLLCLITSFFIISCTGVKINKGEKELSSGNSYEAFETAYKIIEKDPNNLKANELFRKAFTKTTSTLARNAKHFEDIKNYHQSAINYTKYFEVLSLANKLPSTTKAKFGNLILTKDKVNSIQTKTGEAYIKLGDSLKTNFDSHLNRQIILDAYNKASKYINSPTLRTKLSKSSKRAVGKLYLDTKLNSYSIYDKELNHYLKNNLRSKHSNLNYVNSYKKSNLVLSTRILSIRYRPPSVHSHTNRESWIDEYTDKDTGKTYYKRRYYYEREYTARNSVTIFYTYSLKDKISGKTVATNKGTMIHGDRTSWSRYSGFYRPLGSWGRGSRRRLKSEDRLVKEGLNRISSKIANELKWNL